MAGPTFMQSLNTPLGGAAIGSIGGAINSLADASAVRSMGRQQTQQLREQIAYQRQIMEKQIALRAQERVRQQILAQAAGDAFANSLGQYSGFEDRTGAAGGKIADTFRQILERQAPDISPQASGAVADRIASAGQRANERSGAEANNLAAVQGLARAFSDSGIAVNRNNQFAGMTRNFAQGSAGAADAEIEAQAGRLFQPEILQPQRSILGDLFTGLSSLGVAAANKPAAPVSPYALLQPGDNFGQMGLQMRDTPSIGLRTDRPSGLGITGPNGFRLVGG